MPTASAPRILGTISGQIVNPGASLLPFATVSLDDPNAGATDVLTITLAGAAGILSGAGLADKGGGVYALTGSAASVNSQLQALTFTPTPGGASLPATTTFSLSDTSSAWGTVSYDPMQVLTSFNGKSGLEPVSDLLADSAGNLFGTAQLGGPGAGGSYGSGGEGTVFELVKTESGFGAPVVLASFNIINGQDPSAGLIADAAGDLFGTTSLGPSGSFGTVFELVKSAAGYSAPVTLASFRPSGGGTWTSSFGAFPQGRLIVDPAGNLFGTTSFGGAYDCGTVFELVKTTSGYSAPVVLVAFDGDNGARPLAGLIADAAGDLFGTTSLGGAWGYGTVFELVKTRWGYNAPVVLASFNSLDGANPHGGLLADSAGDLFGTTYNGGAEDYGSVFELVKTNSGYSAPVVLGSFNFTNGEEPQASLIADSAGDLFGTNAYGGPDKFGTVFELVKTTSGYSEPVMLASFDRANGAYPAAGLTADAAGNLFGTAKQGGGAADGGTFFEIAATTTLTPVTTSLSVLAAYSPTIQGAQANQATAAEAPLAPFSQVAIGDLNANATETLTVTVNFGGGTLSGAGLADLGGGVYSLSGDAATVTSRLQALLFTPQAAAPASVTTTVFTLKDVSSAGTSALDDETTVIDAAPAVAPTISGTLAGQISKAEAPVQPFAQTTIGDLNDGATDTVTITLSGAAGELSGAALIFNGGVYTLSGTAAAVTEQLRSLTFTPQARTPGDPASTTFALHEESSAGTKASDATTTVVDVNRPTIAGTGASQSDGDPLPPFLHATVFDPYDGAAGTLTITQSGGGVLSGAGLTDLGQGVYTLTGTAAAITSQLQALLFTPATGLPGEHATTTFALSDSSSALAPNGPGAPLAVDTATAVTTAYVAPSTVTLAGPLSATVKAGTAPVTLDLLAGATDSDPHIALHVVLGSGGFVVDGQPVSGVPDGVSVSGDALVVDPSNAAFAALLKGQTQTIAVTFGFADPAGHLLRDASGQIVQQQETVTVEGAKLPSVFTRIADPATGKIVEIVTPGIVGKPYDTVDQYYDLNGRPTEQTLTKGGAPYQETGWNADGSLAHLRFYQAGSAVGFNYASYEDFYTAGARTLRYLYDSAGAVLATQIYSGDGGFSIYAGATQSPASLKQTKTLHADGTYVVNNYNVTGQPFTRVEIFYAADGAVRNTNWYTGASLYRSEDWNADGSVRDIRYYQAGATLGIAYASFGDVYTAGVRTSRVSYDAGGAVVATQIFAADGGYSVYAGATQTPQTHRQTKTTHADSTYDVHDFAIAGQSYTDSDTIYRADGVRLSQTWYKGSDLYQSESWNADGSVHDIHRYSAGAIAGAAYASYDDSYAAGFRDQRTFFDGGGTTVAREIFAPDGGWSIYAGASPTPQSLKQQKLVNADTSHEIVNTNLVGGTATSNALVYDEKGAYMAVGFDYRDGSGGLFLYGDDLTVDVDPDAQTLSTPADTFALTTHANQGIDATGRQHETFAFAPHFGRDVLYGFTTDAASHDLLVLNASAFGSTLTAADQTAAFEVMISLSHLTSDGATSSIITDDFGDSLILRGVSVATLKTSATSVRFV